MDFSHFHFAYPSWLWAIAILPLMWVFFFIFYRKHPNAQQLEKFIDQHLLPYLVLNRNDQKFPFWKNLLVWSIVWSFLSLALAGPRWDFREIESFSRDQSLIILLDLSESMNATDIKPSRLTRAKQKIEDLINLSKGVNIGLIAFAADPHMISPITEDKETIRHLLTSLETDLAYVQGSRLSSALDMASSMLEAEAGTNKSILIISDGGIEDGSALSIAKKIAEKGIVIHSMGIGTFEGSPLRDHKGNIIKKNASPIISKLEKEMLIEISKIGNGHYLEAHYSDRDEMIILNDLAKRADTHMNSGKKNKVWDEYFYFLILPILPMVLWWFRRGYVFALFFIFFHQHFPLEAMTISNYFKNSEQLGQQAFNQNDYETAIHAFQDPYRKGVACYRAGNYPEAEKMFRESFQKEATPHASYNLGNTLVQQQKFQEAIVTYEDVLKKWPDHVKAKENLALVKKILEQQQENSESENSDQQQQRDQDSNQKNENESQDSNKQNESGQDKKNENQQENEQNEGEQESKDETDHEPNDKQQPQENEEQKSQPFHQSEEEPSENIEPSQSVEKEKQEKEPEGEGHQSQLDQEADFWLNRITSDPKKFLKNKFYIESKKNGTKEGIDPW